MVIVNDWSARDLQAWEYVPLGPFLGKSFATSISAWVLPLAALAEATAAPAGPGAAELLDYLDDPSGGYDIDVDVLLNGERLSTCPYATMYYSPAQMLAHLTINGASLRTGDLLGSGTISGPSADELGIPARTELERHPTIGAARRRTHLPARRRRGDHARDGPIAAGSLRLGEVRGRIVP